MPIPKRAKNEPPKQFMSRCMGDDVMKEEYPDQKQRTAICMGKACEYAKYIEIADLQLNYDSTADEKAGYPPNCNDGYVEKDGKCIPKEGEQAAVRLYEYKDPKTGEVYTYEQPGIYKKNGRFLIPVR